MVRYRSRKPYYNDDSDYTTNAPSYYDDLARKQKLIKELAKRIWEYDEKLNESLENIENILNEYITIVDGKLELIDHVIGEGFNDRIEELLREWVNDGTLEIIINEEIFNSKADKDIVEKEFMYINKKINNWLVDGKSIDSDLVYSKNVKWVLPLKFPDYEEVGNGDQLHPQQFYVTNERIYIQHTNKIKKTNVIAVYNRDGDYISCFQTNEYGYAGISIRKVYGQEYLYLKNHGGDNLTHRYNITVLPDNMSIIKSEKTFNVDVSHTYGYNPYNDEFIFQNRQREHFIIYNGDLDESKEINLSNGMRFITRRINESTDKGLKSPLPQGFTMSNDYIIVSIGSAGSNKYTGLNQQGILISDRDGNFIKSGALNPVEMKNQLVNEGYNATRIENEGVSFSEDGSLYSLTVTTEHSNEVSDSEGIIIFEEYSTHDNAINFKHSSVPLLSFNGEQFTYNSLEYVDSDGYFLNPVTRDKFESINDVMNFMEDYDVNHLYFFKNSYRKIKDIMGNDVTGGVYFSLTKTRDYIKGIETSTVYTNEFSKIISSGLVRYDETQPKNDLLVNNVLIEKGININFQEGDYSRFIINVMIGNQNKELIIKSNSTPDKYTNSELTFTRINKTHSNNFSLINLGLRIFNDNIYPYFTRIIDYDGDVFNASEDIPDINISVWGVY